MLPDLELTAKFMHFLKVLFHFISRIKPTCYVNIFINIGMERHAINFDYEHKRKVDSSRKAIKRSTLEFQISRKIGFLLESSISKQK